MTAGQPIPPPATVTPWVGLVVFAGALMAVSGFFTLVQALFALFDDAVYVQADGQVLLVSLTTWGWVHLALGSLQILVGLAVLRGSLWARLVAAVVVGVNAIAQMVFLPAYPIWSVAVIAVDILVIWALCMHGREVADA
jgi:hypothetical protein